METHDSGLPFTDVSRNLLYRLSTPSDHLHLIDSSFGTDRVFHAEYENPSSPSTGLGFGINLIDIQLDTPIHKDFPDDDSDEDDGEEGITVVVEDIPRQTIAGFITVNFSAWNSRLIIADIEIDPSYRRQGIGGALVKFAERTACSRYPVRQVWLEVSNVNYPAIRSYLRMGFQVAGLDLSLYTATEAEGEFAMLLWKPLQ